MTDSFTTGSEKDFSNSDEVTQWSRYDVAGNENQKVVTHTFKYNGEMLRNYTILYDKTKKAALWAAFAMNGDIFPKNVTRGDDWQYDPAIPNSWQPKLSSSYGGGYSRGHQVASNDRKTTLYQMYQTNYFTNMTPQLEAFNAGSSTVWDELEGDIQDLGYSLTGNVMLYVVTGAFFGSGYKTDATDNDNVACPVPTQYYKCIMKVTYNSSGVVTGATGAAYLFDHRSGAPQQNKTIRELETLTSFNFFANIPSQFQESAETIFTNMF